MNRYLSIIATWFTAIQFVVFGANKFLLFFIAPPPADAAAQAFMGGMFGSYLASLVGATEIAGSILLLIPRTKFIGLLMLIPVMLNIVLYHLAHDLPGNMIWMVVLTIFAAVCYSNRSSFQSLLKINVQ
jgi:putative oxidoreductase